ncbi:hypothetical protein [uncultured Clostridium sp.]|nr:hypothetical protein [uncultured Clostridium sp.]
MLNQRIQTTKYNSTIDAGSDVSRISINATGFSAVNSGTLNYICIE